MRVLYFDLDALNPTHLGCYGYHRNTSPNIDTIAQQGVRCTNMYTSDAPCLPSRSAFYSGQFGIHSGVVGHGGTAADRRREGPTRGFRDRLAREGFAAFMQHDLQMKTAMVSPFGQRHSAWHFYAGFNEIFNTGGGGMDVAEQVTPDVIKWLDDNKEKEDVYLHVNYWDIHTPYRYPEEYGNQFENDPLPEWLTEEVFEKHKQEVGPHTAQEISMWDDKENKRFPFHPGGLKTMSDLRKMIDGYDTSIKLVDDHLGRIVQWLKDNDMYDDTAIIISADHGENMGEMAIYGEHGTADHATCNIPFIVKWPGGAEGVVDEGLHYNIDVAPTVAELFDKPRKNLWDGESFAKTLLTGEEQGHEDIVVSQCAHVCQRAVRWDDWIYIRTYHCGYRLHPQEQLFNLKDDPYEQTNIAQQNPQMCKEGAWRLSRWHDKQMASSDFAEDPLWTVMRENGPMHTWGALENYVERLKDTGRADGAKALAEKYAHVLNG